MRYRNRRPLRRPAGVWKLPDWSARRWYVTAFAALGFVACGLSAGPVLGRVAVDAYPTDVVFGAGQPSPVPAPATAPGLGLSQPFPSLFLGNNFALPEIATQTCAVAPPTGAPAEEAGLDVTTKPKPGLYQWVGAGQYLFAISGNTLHLPVPPFLNVFERGIQDSAEPIDTLQSLPGSSPGMDFTYDMVEPAIGGAGFTQFVWRVKTNAQTGDPEGGLSLAEVDILNGAGQVVQTAFKGEPGLLMMPFPVSEGPVGIQGPNGGIQPTVAADTSGSNNSLQWNGTVGGRERIDACGTWIQAWQVDGTLTIGTNSTPATIHMDVATQFGGLVVAFNIDGPFFGVMFNKFTQHIGTVTPGPLPKGFQ